MRAQPSQLWPVPALPRSAPRAELAQAQKKVKGLGNSSFVNLKHRFSRHRTSPQKHTPIVSQVTSPKNKINFATSKVKKTFLIAGFLDLSSIQLLVFSKNFAISLSMINAFSRHKMVPQNTHSSDQKTLLWCWDRLLTIETLSPPSQKCSPRASFV